MNVLVIGDLALDVNSFGKYSGYSRELEGLPVFHVTHQTFNGGGAANLAGNLASLGNKVHVVGLLGDELYGMRLRRWFDSMGIYTGYTIRSNSTQVYGKYWLYHQHLLRIDIDADFAKLDDEIDEDMKAIKLNIDAILAHSSSIKKPIDCIIVADYNELGYDTVVTPELVEFVSHKPCLKIGTSRTKPEMFSGFDYVVGNHEELEEPLTYNNLLDNNSFVIETRGIKGAILKSKGYAEIIETTPAEPPIDPCGCGDTFLAVFATSICSGDKETVAIKCANAGARWTSTQIGTTGYPTIEQVEIEYKEVYANE